MGTQEESERGVGRRGVMLVRCVSAALRGCSLLLLFHLPPSPPHPPPRPIPCRLSSLVPPDDVRRGELGVVAAAARHSLRHTRPGDTLCTPNRTHTHSRQTLAAPERESERGDIIQNCSAAVLVTLLLFVAGSQKIISTDIEFADLYTKKNLLCGKLISS